MYIELESGYGKNIRVVSRYSWKISLASAMSKPSIRDTFSPTKAAPASRREESLVSASHAGQGVRGVGALFHVSPHAAPEIDQGSANPGNLSMS